MPKYIALILLPFFAGTAGALDWTQDAWQGGAVAGSTAAQLSGWDKYDSDDGDLLPISTGITLQNINKSIFRTDETSGIYGFNEAGAVLNGTVLSGTGTAAQLKMDAGGTVSVISTSALALSMNIEQAIYYPSDKKFYIAGISAGGLTDLIIDYNPQTGSSRVKNSTTTWISRYGIAYHPQTDKIYIFGGEDYYAHGRKILEYDPVNDVLAEKSAQLPESRDFLGAVYCPATGKIYVFGGETETGNIEVNDTTFTYHHDILEYDPLTDVLVKKSTGLPVAGYMPDPVYYPGTGKIYVVYANFYHPDDLYPYFSRIMIYDPLSGTIALSSPFPEKLYDTRQVYNPKTQKIYVFATTNPEDSTADRIYAYDISTDTFTLTASRLIIGKKGGNSLAYSEDTQKVYIFGDGAETFFAGTFDKTVQEYSVAASSEMYVSPVFDAGNLASLGNISWNPALQSTASVNLTVGFRAGGTPASDASWSDSGNFAGVSNGAPLSAFGPARYMQYTATFTTTDVSTSPVLDDITITYAQTAPSATLVSSAFDSGSALNTIRRMGWQGNFPTNTYAMFRIRTSSDDGSGFPAAWGNWLGPTSDTDYYTDPSGGQPVNTGQRDGINDRWFQYKAVMVSSNTLNTPVLSTVTVTFAYLPDAPVLNSLTAGGTTWLTAQWTDNSTAEDVFVISSGTLPAPVNTGVSAAALNKPGAGGVQSADIDNLAPNTRYYARVRAKILAPEELYSHYSNELNAATLVNPPSAFSVLKAYVSSAAFAWESNGSPSWTPYEISVSTDNFNTVLTTAVPFSGNLTALSTTAYNLNPGTAYYFRIRGQNLDGIAGGFGNVVSTETLPLPVSGLSGAALGVSSTVWTWNSSGGAAARYRVYPASGGAVIYDTPDTAYTQTALSTNTPYGIKVEACDNAGSAGLSSPATVYTLAAVPGAPAAANVTSQSAALSWGAGGNPSWTPYEVAVSTDGFITHFSTPVPFAVGLTANTTAVYNLSQGTAYDFRIRARNGDGLASGFSNSISMQTLPGALAPPFGAALGVSSITWNWNNTAGPSVNRYRIYRPGTGFFLGEAVSPLFTDTGLSTNTAYAIAVKALNESGAGPLSPASTVYTLASAPDSLSISAVYFSSITIVWNSNGNPANTVFEIHRSTDNSLYLSVAATTALSLIDPELAAGNTYYYRVRGINGAGLPGNFNVAVSAFLIGDAPLAPSGLTANADIAGKITLAWTHSPTLKLPYYNIYRDSGTGGVDYTVKFASVPGAVDSFTTDVLAPGNYCFGLRAQNPVLEEKNTNLIACASIAASEPFADWVQASIKIPKSGKKIWGNRITVMAEIARGALSAVKQVEFEYRAAGSTTAPWVQIPAVMFNNPDPKAPYFIHWDVSSLPQGNYEVRAVAMNTTDKSDPSPSSILLTTNNLDPDVEENAQGISIYHRERIYKDIDNKIFFGSLYSDQAAELKLPAGALSQTASTLLSVLSPPLSVPSSPRELLKTGIYYGISLESGQNSLGKPAVLTATYRDDDNDGLVDGTLARADRLIFMVYDTLNEVWKQEAPASVDMKNKTVTGRTSHFSTFGVFAQAASNLKNVRVYPVPFVPNDGLQDNGKPYNCADPDSGIIFANLTQTCRVEIYTVSGELVWEKATDDSSGKIQWNVKNKKGEDAAFGVYIALILDTLTGEKAVRKIAVIK
ncbi:MAG: fibronectin type III domain-containing protein [Elusimicrobia bacterium]|nr:fibronectin type III domain-containing protein [Elusimicrobiota bacterium]